MRNAGIIEVLMKVLTPIIFIINRLSLLFLKLFGVDPQKTQNQMTEEEYELTIVFKSETPFYEIGSFIINNLLDKFKNLQMWNLKRRGEK